jgi:hypothetical protein
MAKKASRHQARGGEDSGSDMTTTAIHLPVDRLNLLKAAAFARSKKHGGRASVSALLSEIVGRHEAELRREAGRYLELMTPGD